jgi:DMSO/TMAO reductase YedYZ molybdopterin-dependent catalytic subunit
MAGTTHELTRRAILRGGVAGLGLMALPGWALPALAQDQQIVPFTDYPDGWKTERGPESRLFDIRTLDAFTPADQFFTTQHLGHPTIDGAAFRLQVTGLVDREAALSLDDLRGLGQIDLDAGFECSGNSARSMQGLASNGRWTGVHLQDVLRQVGVKPNAREVVFFGADKGTEEVEFRGRTYPVEQHYGRSISIAQATAPEPFLATALNGAPLTVHQGFPLRLIMPGWYGAPNVKWVANIHVQEDPYLGKYQARWYRTLRAETIGGEQMWKETAITRMRLKSVVARVTRQGDTLTAHGFVLNDGTPIRSVEVRVDNGPWTAATVAAGQNTYAWKLFSYNWSGASQGEHTIVSRATDSNGEVQPTSDDLATKKTFLEDNAQHERTFMIG